MCEDNNCNKDCCNTTIKHFWLNQLPAESELCPNSIYFIKGTSCIKTYVTSLNKVALPICAKNELFRGNMYVFRTVSNKNVVGPNPAIGDVIKGFWSDTLYIEAQYLGGDLTNLASFKISIEDNYSLN